MSVLSRSFARSRHLAVCSLAVAVTVLGTARLSADESQRWDSPIVQAVVKARPSVVNIRGRKRVGQNATLVEANGSRQVNGMGTGVIIDERGYILTNYHVVEGVERIQVTLADEQTLIARLIAHDTTTDLAVIKIDHSANLPIISTGTSSDLMPGETVIAVGNAYGYDHTVTSGIISALHRPVQVSETQKYHDLIQTDASINPGNSGGPLLNIDGEMIGINVAVRVGAQGIGFAIPVNEAMAVAGNLLTVDRVERLSHGILGKLVEHDGASRFQVSSTRSDSPGEKSGLQAGDILTHVDGKPVRWKLDIERAMLGRAEGEEISLSVDREGESVDLSLVIESTPRVQGGVSERTWKLLGVRLAPVSQRQLNQPQARYRGGLKVVAVRENGAAAQQGIQRGDVLVGMHKWETVSMENVAYILNSEEFQRTQPCKFFILRNGETLYGNLRASF